eukprot:TRINITY_DN2624_c0_g1_i1.p1 TRINITY_DN2624_c0_g1~~TRINITY_DN2624_c0_g1_i1.p1  ORF type:complete len:114 (-),score=13.11 TRINITY_DN2624_c0_g1_i1:19-360(-)
MKHFITFHCVNDTRLEFYLDAYIIPHQISHVNNINKDALIWCSLISVTLFIALVATIFHDDAVHPDRLYTQFEDELSFEKQNQKEGAASFELVSSGAEKRNGIKSDLNGKSFL